MKIKAYTDGACKGNPGIGGWGWVSYHTNKESIPLVFTDYGGDRQTTNNGMELQAMVEFLIFCPTGEHVDVQIYSDSKYVLGWFIGQKTESRVENNQQGWFKGRVNNDGSCWKKQPDKNADILQQLNEHLLRHLKMKTCIRVGWVKGHSGVKGNERADKLANNFVLQNS